MHITISGIGGAVPRGGVTNEAISQQLNIDPEWIASRTGVRHRYHAGRGAMTSSLAAEAAKNALQNSGNDRDIDMILLATTTPDRLCPATAPKVAYRLGLYGIPAVDISAVCSGFIYGLQLAIGILKADMARRVMVIGAEIYTKILDPSDRTTFPIFGDGAGAMVIERGDGEHIIDISTGSNGKFEDLITVRGGGVEAHFNADMVGKNDLFFRMDGKAVFQMAVETMARSVSELLKRNQLSPRDVDYVVGHQANARILQAVGQMLDLSSEKVIISLDRYGNTSAASIPLALSHAVIDGTIKAHDTVAITAFGGGLTWGSAILRWPNLRSVPIISEIAPDSRDEIKDVHQA